MTPDTDEPLSPEATQFEWHFAAISDAGPVRDHNEDAVGAVRLRGGGVFAVLADGMGGHRAGEVASRLAVECITHHCLGAPQLETLNTVSELEALLTQAFNGANQAILNGAVEQAECRGMGTTAIVALLFGQRLALAHTGDSRAYLLRHGTMSRLTVDHSALELASRMSTEDRERFFPSNLPISRSWLICALGTRDSWEPDIAHLTLERNDQVLLCSDGLTDTLSDQEIAQCLERRSQETVFDQANALIHEAVARQAGDNVSIVLIQGSTRRDQSPMP